MGGRTRTHVSYKLQSMALVTEGGASRARVATAIVLTTAIRQAIPVVDRMRVFKIGRALWRCIQRGLRFSIRFAGGLEVLLQSRHVAQKGFGFVRRFSLQEDLRFLDVLRYAQSVGIEASHDEAWSGHSLFSRHLKESADAVIMR